MTVYTVEISSKIFWPKGPKIFGDQNNCAGDQILKLRSQLAPKFFFLKSSPENAVFKCTGSSLSGEKKIFFNLASKAKCRYHLLPRDVQYERYRKHMEVSVYLTTQNRGSFSIKFLIDT